MHRTNPRLLYKTAQVVQALPIASVGEFVHVRYNEHSATWCVRSVDGRTVDQVSTHYLDHFTF